MDDSMSAMLSETEAIIQHLNNQVEFMRSPEFQENKDKLEHLNEIKEMNLKLKSALSFHQAWPRTDDVFSQKVLFNAIQREKENMEKHLAEMNTKQTATCWGLDNNPKKIKKRGGGLNSMNVHLQQELESIRQVVQGQESKFKALEQLTGSLTLDYVTNLEGKINCLQQAMDDLAFRVTSLQDGDKRNRESVNDLSAKAISTDLTLGTLVSEREKEDCQLKEFECRLLEAETNRRKDLNFYQQKLTGVENLYKQVCELMAGHVEPLRRLQDTLNKRVVMTENRQLQASQVESITDAVMDLLPRVYNLECRGRHQAVGFTAYLPLVTKMTTSCVIKEFTDVRCNEGNCYNPANGTFTAPQNGLYFVSVTLRQRKDGKVDANLLASRPGSGEMKIVGKTATHSDKKCSTAVGVIKLKAGDVLFVRAVSVTPEASLSQYSSFTCYLIG